MMYRLAILLFLVTTSVLAQDVLTVGSGVAPVGGSVAIPVTLDEHSGIGVRGVAFKVLFPSELVTSVTFARSGAAALLTPLHETALQGSGFCSYIAFFNEALPDQIGTLTVTLNAATPAGSTIALAFHAPSVALSNQTASVVETVANGNLSLVNGSVTVSALATPANLVATAPNASQVNVDWSDVAGADHYQLWRSSNGDAYAVIDSPSASAFTDSTVSANTTYLYRVQAIDSGGDPSAFSNIDAATTIVFSADATIRATHITQLRTAVNAMRSAAGLGALAADGTIAVGAPIRASHVAALRTGLNQARSVIGLTALTYTDPTLTAGVTKVKTSHLEELRNGVR
ncbi:MAG: hypothetical protein ACJ74H_14425 [Thermoanaerobaculia bacterium]